MRAMRLNTEAWHEALIGVLAIVGLIGFVAVMVAMLVVIGR